MHAAASPARFPRRCPRSALSALSERSPHSAHAPSPPSLTPARARGFKAGLKPSRGSRGRASSSCGPAFFSLCRESSCPGRAAESLGRRLGSTSAAGAAVTSIPSENPDPPRSPTQCDSERYGIIKHGKRSRRLLRELKRKHSTSLDTCHAICLNHPRTGDAQILALESTDGALLCRSLLWGSTCNDDLLWDLNLLGFKQRIISVSSSMVPAVKHKRQTKAEEPQCQKKPAKEIRAIKEAALITTQEFEDVPAYLKGRITYDQINAVVQEINKAVVGKYKIVYQPLKSMSAPARNLYHRFMEEETKDTNGLFFVVDDDIKMFTKLKLDKRFYIILSILRHCQRVREIRGSGLVRYELCPWIVVTYCVLPLFFLQKLMLARELEKRNSLVSQGLGEHLSPLDELFGHFGDKTFASRSYLKTWQFSAGCALISAWPVLPEFAQQQRERPQPWVPALPDGLI
ncbi:hypothetical protein DV515_00016565 [Chloebia gouldiae]|uniref:SKA complex subunit 1 n=1 Tax=Chloebia gouldiae TaxID=44316 RepID=A0A3L8RSL1_CHLGU|nr:hypothetical protein DV515_00016565 [Chloebia gouldiae]